VVAVSAQKMASMLLQAGVTRPSHEVHQLYDPNQKVIDNCESTSDIFCQIFRDQNAIDGAWSTLCFCHPGNGLSDSAALLFCPTNCGFSCSGIDLANTTVPQQRLAVRKGE
jgi:hypothetical protein